MGGRLGTSLLALVLSGCMVGPDYAPPPVDVNAAWLDRTSLSDSTASDAVPTASMSAADAAIDKTWWTSFNDPVLTALVLNATEQNLTLRSAGLRVLQARARRGIAVGRFFPQMQEAFGGIQGNQVSANSPVVGDRSFAEDSIGLQAAWELDFWGKFRRGIEASDADVLARVADYDSVLVSLEAEVATNYILVRSMEERLRFAEQNVKLQKETLQLTETRFNAGAVSELDVTTARATLKATQALIPDFENAREQSILALGVLLGRTPSSLEDILPRSNGEHALPAAPETIAAGVPADLLRRRPDLRAAERQAAAQCARIGVAKADLYPAISIAGVTGFASSNWEGGSGPKLGSIFDGSSFTGFVGLQVQWPIFNYGRIWDYVRERDAQFQEAITNYEEGVLRAAAEVESGLSIFLRSHERARFLSEGVEASRRSSDLSLIQYRAGAVDFIRVNEALTSLVQSEDGLVVARAAVSLGAIQAYRALGGGWEIHRGREFVDPATAKEMQERTDWGGLMESDWSKHTDLGFSRPQSRPEAVDPVLIPTPTEGAP